jgi:hypothetical protein
MVFGRKLTKIWLVEGWCTLLYIWPQFTIGSLKIENLPLLPLRLLLGRLNKWEVLHVALSGDHYWPRYDWS